MDYILENIRRNATLKKQAEEYDPITGLGCCGQRRLLHLSDAPHPKLYLPEAMFELPLLQELSQYKNIASFFKKHKSDIKELLSTSLDKDISSEDVNAFLFMEFWFMFCEIRYVYDYEFYAVCTQTILHKQKGCLVSFVLNVPQRIILEEFEKARLANDPLRFNILKSRQFGSSTFIENYFEWIQIVHKTFWNSVICAHIQDPSKRIREMYERSIRNKPDIKGVKMSIRGFQNSQNIKEIPERGCTITVGTALEPNGVRSDAVKLCHLSEVSFFPNTEMNNPEKLEASITSSIPEIPYTAIIRETTANGQDYFYTQYTKAKEGEVAFRNIFIPWFKMSEYSQPFNGFYSLHNGRKKKGTADDFVKGMNEYEKNLFLNNESCTLEHLNWYRAKAGTMPSLSLMKQEYPSDDIEAFQFSGMPVFRSEDIERQRANCCAPEAIGTLASACPPALWNTDPQRRKDILKNIRFIEDRESLVDYVEGDTAMKAKAIRDKLQVWAFPDTDTKISNRYVVTFDPQKGLSESADFAVISVIDRYWRMYGGCDEVVAQWRGRYDKDIEIWIAAQIAKWYCNALLVVEVNTFDNDSGQVDDSEYIFEIISDYYDNLYRREVKDKIKGEILLKYGFLTIRKTKTSLIENYRAVTREDDYTERDYMCLDEARVYEQTKQGKWEAKKGFHDDILMSRMIGLYVSNQMDPPKKIIPRTETRNNNASGSYASL